MLAASILRLGLPLLYWSDAYWNESPREGWLMSRLIALKTVGRSRYNAGTKRASCWYLLGL